MFEKKFKEQDKVCYKKYLKPEKSITAFSRRKTRNAVTQIFDTMFQSRNLMKSRSTNPEFIRCLWLAIEN